MALLHTLERYDRGQFEIHLAAGRAHDRALDLLVTGQPISVPLSFIPNLQRNIHPFRDLLATLHLFVLIRRGRYDLVHTHTSKAGFLGRWAAWAAGVPAILHSSHGTILEGYFSPAVTWLFATLERLTARISSAIICLTQLEISQYLRARVGSRSQYTHVYNGIDLERFRPRSSARQSARNRLACGRDTVVYMTVGRLVPVKGYDDLLQAFRTVVERVPQSKLFIIGEGERRARLERQACTLGLEEAVEFLGWREDVDDLLDACDVFVLSSLNEGLGLVVVEAMAKKLPVVATRVGGVPEVVVEGRTGVLVKPSSPNDMAEAMVELGSSPELRSAFGSAGRRRAEKYFSIESTVRSTEAIYVSLSRP